MTCTACTELLLGNKAIRTAATLFVVVSALLTEITIIYIIAPWSSFSSIVASSKDLSTASTFISLLFLLFSLTLALFPKFRELDQGLDVLLTLTYLQFYDVVAKSSSLDSVVLLSCTADADMAVGSACQYLYMLGSGSCSRNRRCSISTGFGGTLCLFWLARGLISDIC